MRECHKFEFKSITPRKMCKDLPMPVPRKLCRWQTFGNPAITVIKIMDLWIYLAQSRLRGILWSNSKNSVASKSVDSEESPLGKV
jgi:hypothetical protein